MTRNHYFLFVVCALFAMFFGCKKDSNSSTSKSNLLTANTWTLQTIETQQSNGTWTTDGQDHISLTFHSDGTFAEVYNSSSESGSWQLSSDGSTLTIGGGAGISGTYSVGTLSSSTLQITTSSIGLGGVSQQERFTYMH